MSDVYSKLISFVSDFNGNFPKLKESGFDEGTKLYRLIKEYALAYINAGNGLTEIVNGDIPLEIQELYESDEEVKNFFDALSF